VRIAALLIAALAVATPAQADPPEIPSPKSIVEDLGDDVVPPIISDGCYRHGQDVGAALVMLPEKVCAPVGDEVHGILTGDLPGDL
jgi:hypothetical protein